MQPNRTGGAQGKRMRRRRRRRLTDKPMRNMYEADCYNNGFRSGTVIRAETERTLIAKWVGESGMRRRSISSGWWTTICMLCRSVRVLRSIAAITCRAWIGIFENLACQRDLARGREGELRRQAAEWGSMYYLHTVGELDRGIFWVFFQIQYRSG